MAYNRVVPTDIQQINSQSSELKRDLLAQEEPLEIKLGFGKKENRQQKSLAVTMRTPGHDQELALGFLLGEGILSEPGEITYINYCKDSEGKLSENVIRVELSETIHIDWGKFQRHFYSNSSCGICGKASIESLEQICPKPISENFQINSELIHGLGDKMREAQLVFEHTGGLHAAAIFNGDGQLLLMREDVGRHNAVDKLIGACRLKNLELNKSLLMLSGRISFELVQKALMANIPIVTAIGAPSSLAVETAKNFNMTLLGFTRNNRFNLYSGSERVKMNFNSPKIEQ